MVLDDIVDKKRRYLEYEKKKISLETMKSMVKKRGIGGRQDFYGAIKHDDCISLIAEIKKASPSRGIIRGNFDPVSIAYEYFSKGVQAISVLTEKDFFLGSDEYLIRLRQSFPLPLLRKDFIIDLWQVYQSAYLGADAILLIVSILDNKELKKFQIVAEILGMQCLVEVHSEEEAERAIDSGAKIVGINNRNLKTFKTEISTTEKLMGIIPHDRAVVSESGIKTGDDIKYLSELGVDAVLVGESLMSADSIGNKLKELMGSRGRIKVEG